MSDDYREPCMECQMYHEHECSERAEAAFNRHAEVETLRAQVSALRETLKGIAWANRFDRSRLFSDDAEFIDWAQSRARHALREEPQS